MKLKDLLLLAILLVLIFGFLFLIVLPVSPSYDPHRPRHHERLGPGGGIQRGAYIDLPAHPVPWLGPGGIHTGADIDLPAHPVPWIGGHGGQRRGYPLNPV